MEPLSPIVAHVVAILTAVAGIAVGLGAFGAEEAQILVGAAGTILGAVFAIVNVIHHKAVTVARAIERTPNARVAP